LEVERGSARAGGEARGPERRKIKVRSGKKRVKVKLWSVFRSMVAVAFQALGLVFVKDPATR
jgi:hypothetical protein